MSGEGDCQAFPQLYGWGLEELKLREPVHLVGPLCITPSRLGLEFPLRYLPLLLGVLVISLPSQTCFVKNCFASAPGAQAEPSQVLTLEPTTIPHFTAEVSVSSSWDLFSSSIWDPSWFWPLGDATRFPLPQRILRDSASLYPSSSCPFKCYAPPALPPAQGWGRRRRRRPARPPAPPLLPPGPAPGEARHPRPVPESLGGPPLRPPCLEIPTPRDSGSDPPPAGAALPLSPALSTRSFLPCPLRPESRGFSRLWANLSRVTLQFWTQDPPPLRLPC